MFHLQVKREEAKGAARPYAGASVAYSVAGAPAGTVRTDKYGRYFVGGLGHGEVLSLHPEEKHSWTLTPVQQAVAAGREAKQAKPFVYEPDAVSLIQLLLIGKEGSALASWEREDIKDTVYYQLPCNQTLHLSCRTPDGVTADVKVASEAASEAATESVIRHDGNRVAVNLSKGGRKVLAITLSSGKRYTLVLDKPYGLFDIVTEHLGNVRVVNNNPLLNGGLKFSSCDWWYKKAGEGWKLVSTGGKLHYSVGAKISDKFGPNDSMRLVLYTVDGRAVATCADADVRSKGNANGSLGSKGEAGRIDDSAYPNPVAGGEKIYLKESILIAGREERYSTFRLFTSLGRLVADGNASLLVEGLTMPNDIGTYYLVLDGKAGRRTIQIAVGE